MGSRHALYPCGNLIRLVALSFTPQQALLNEFHTTAASSLGSPGSETPLLETATWATCLGVVKEMTDMLTQAERIRDTPIPVALGIHVQVSGPQRFCITCI